MYSSYTLYQADHIKTTRQQREEDIRTGELAADFGRLWHALAPRRSGGERRDRQGGGGGPAGRFGPPHPSSAARPARPFATAVEADRFRSANCPPQEARRLIDD